MCHFVSKQLDRHLQKYFQCVESHTNVVCNRIKRYWFPITILFTQLGMYSLI